MPYIEQISKGNPARRWRRQMVNSLVHDIRIAEKLVVEDCEQLADAIRYFGTDFPLDRTYCVELLIETLSDGSEASSIRVRLAEPV
jgi:hypothetical protein